MELKADIPAVAAMLAALLITSDGEIDEREKRVASIEGTRMFPGFSTLYFETLLEGVDDLPQAGELAGMVKELIEPEGKREIMTYLAAVANADDRVVDIERAKLQAVAENLGTDMPDLTISSVGG